MDTLVKGAMVKDEADEAKEYWDAGRRAMQRTSDLLKAGRLAEVFPVLDEAIALANEEKRSTWLRILCRHGEALAHARGDLEREIRYAEQALHAADYRFGLYNLARLLLRAGQAARAESCATEAYKLALTEKTEADRDLVAAILKQWPHLRDTCSMA